MPSKKNQIITVVQTFNPIFDLMDHFHHCVPVTQVSHSGEVSLNNVPIVQCVQHIAKSKLENNLHFLK